MPSRTKETSFPNFATRPPKPELMTPRIPYRKDLYTEEGVEAVTNRKPKNTSKIFIKFMVERFSVAIQYQTIEPYLSNITSRDPDHLAPVAHTEVFQGVQGRKSTIRVSCSF
ncbi:hypothetical protein TNCV_2739081 [Trichonephila clavipes]|nr:hypothetical protein TNCV_2739081 [Trichonephila clavipes]